MYTKIVNLNVIIPSVADLEPDFIWCDEKLCSGKCWDWAEKTEFSGPAFGIFDKFGQIGSCFGTSRGPPASTVSTMLYSLCSAMESSMPKHCTEEVESRALSLELLDWIRSAWNWPPWSIWQWHCYWWWCYCHSSWWVGSPEGVPPAKTFCIVPHRP